jgi:predicted acetyltransferase
MRKTLGRTIIALPSTDAFAVPDYTCSIAVASCDTIVPRISVRWLASVMATQSSMLIAPLLEDSMLIETTLAGRDEQAILQRLMEFYLYDFSEFDGTDVDANGIYGYDYLDDYWSKPQRYPLLVRVDHNLAGFVLVNDHAYHPPSNRSIAEFFVMRKYRRRGVGRRVACTVFDQLPGHWEVRQLQENRVAQAFWRTVIDQYTHGQYTEQQLAEYGWDGPAQIFDTTSTEGCR